MIHTGTKIIKTARLILRPFEFEDCSDMLKNWIANPKVQFEYGEPIYTTKSEVDSLLEEWTDNYTKPDFYRWAIIEKESNENIGQIAFCRVYTELRIAELEYCIGESFWGNGYALEALLAIIDFTFKETEFLKLEAYHRAENIKSGKVLIKSAMHITNNVQRFIIENTEPHGEICYCITRDEMI